jgi:hypothetical protein
MECRRLHTETVGLPAVDHFLFDTTTLDIGCAGVGLVQVGARSRIASGWRLSHLCGSLRKMENRGVWKASVIPYSFDLLTKTEMRNHGNTSSQRSLSGERYRLQILEATSK